VREYLAKQERKTVKAAAKRSKRDRLEREKKMTPIEQLALHQQRMKKQDDKENQAGPSMPKVGEK
jgi:hypothetical protein